MRVIDLDVTGATENAADLKAKLEAEAVSTYFSRVTVSENVVSCYVGNEVWMTITIKDSTANNSVTFYCVGDTEHAGTLNSRFIPNNTCNYIGKLIVFDTAILVVPRSSVDEFRYSIAITKAKSGKPTVIAANTSTNTNGNVVNVTVGVGNLNSSTGRVNTAAEAFENCCAHQMIRTYEVSGNASIYGVPVWTGSSYTENVLESVVSAFSDRYAYHQITVNGTSYYAVIYDSIYIKSN